MTTRALRSRVKRRARQARVQIEPELLDRLVAYFELLSRWNEKINLTSLSDPDEAIDRLILEPLAALQYLPSTARSLMDIGSGGGSPALPIKLARPSLKLRMVESKTRKAAFLREAVRHLSLVDAVVEAARYEELLARPDLHEASDLISIRALRLDARVLVGVQAFLKPEGYLVLFRGPVATEPGFLPPPLQWAGTFPLIESLRSRLVLIRKIPVGMAPATSGDPVAVSG